MKSFKPQKSNIMSSPSPALENNTHWCNLNYHTNRDSKIIKNTSKLVLILSSLAFCQMTGLSNPTFSSPSIFSSSFHLSIRTLLQFIQHTNPWSSSPSLSLHLLPVHCFVTICVLSGGIKELSYLTLFYT